MFETHFLNAVIELKKKHVLDGVFKSISFDKVELFLFKLSRSMTKLTK